MNFLHNILINVRLHCALSKTNKKGVKKTHTKYACLLNGRKTINPCIRVDLDELDAGGIFYRFIEFSVQCAGKFPGHFDRPTIDDIELFFLNQNTWKSPPAVACDFIEICIFQVF